MSLKEQRHATNQTIILFNSSRRKIFLELIKYCADKFLKSQIRIDNILGFSSEDESEENGKNDDSCLNSTMNTSMNSSVSEISWNNHTKHDNSLISNKFYLDDSNISLVESCDNSYTSLPSQFGSKKSQKQKVSQYNKRQPEIVETPTAEGENIQTNEPLLIFNSRLPKIISADLPEMRFLKGCVKDLMPHDCLFMQSELNIFYDNKQDLQSTVSVELWAGQIGEVERINILFEKNNWLGGPEKGRLGGFQILSVKLFVELAVY